jgi:hypothetical protein
MATGNGKAIYSTYSIGAATPLTTNDIGSLFSQTKRGGTRSHPSEIAAEIAML